MGFIERIALRIVQVTDNLGYTALVFTMALERVIAPAPSEIDRMALSAAAIAGPWCARGRIRHRRTSA